MITKVILAVVLVILEVSLTKSDFSNANFPNSEEFIPSIHHQDLVKFLKEPSKKRNFEEKNFILNGIEFRNKKINLSLKKSVPDHSDFSVYLDGKLQNVENSYPLFTGTVSDDTFSIVVVSFPGFHEGDYIPQGMIHWSNGETHVIGANKNTTEYDGIYIHEIDKNNSLLLPLCDQKLPGNKIHSNITYKTSSKKRDVQENGLDSISLLNKYYSIKTAFIGNSALLSLFGGSTQSVSNYVRNVVAAINVMYKRDIMAELSITHIGLYTTDVATDLYSLRTFLLQQSQKSIQWNVAMLLRGGTEGGLGMVGAVCSDYGVAHGGVSGTYGTNSWDSLWDFILIAHEIGHVLGSGHTHDSYNPVIDNCGNGVPPPSDKGTVMSYCHTVAPMDGCSSALCNVVTFMGEVSRYGYKSERVNQNIRTHLQNKDSCLEFSSGGSSTGSTTPTTGSKTPTTGSATPTTGSTTPTTGSTTPAPPTTGSPTTGTTTPGTAYTLVDQMQLGSVYIYSQYFSDKRSYAETADDFVVPNGQVWTLSQVIAAGGWIPGTAFASNTNFFVIILSDNGGSPGTIVPGCNVAGKIVGSIQSQVTLNYVCKLTPGRWWIQISAELSGNNYWVWRTSSSNNGYSSYFRDVGSLVSNQNCRIWQPVTNCFSSNQRDLAFRLIGYISSSLNLANSDDEHNLPFRTEDDTVVVPPRAEIIESEHNLPYKSDGNLPIRATSEDERSLIGNQNANSENDRLLTGHQNANSDSDRILVGNQNANSENDRLLTGHQNANSDSDRLLIGHLNANSDSDRFLVGHQNTNSENDRLLTGRQSNSP